MSNITLLELDSITVSQTPTGTISFTVSGSPLDAYYDLYAQIVELEDELTVCQMAWED